MYEARQIANYILSEFGKDHDDLSNLKINKLLFFVQVWSLIRLGYPLIRNHFEAWVHGPVVRTIYESLKKYGDGPVSQPIEFLNYISGKMETVEHLSIEDAHRDFIKKIAGHYIQFNAFDLRELTHEANGPWEKVYASKGLAGASEIIPIDLIQSFYASKYGSGRGQV